MVYRRKPSPSRRPTRSSPRSSPSSARRRLTTYARSSSSQGSPTNPTGPISNGAWSACTSWSIGGGAISRSCRSRSSLSGGVDYGGSELPTSDDLRAFAAWSIVAQQHHLGGVAHRVRIRGLDRRELELVLGGQAQDLLDLIGREAWIREQRTTHLGDLQPRVVDDDDLEQDPRQRAIARDPRDLGGRQPRVLEQRLPDVLAIEALEHDPLVQLTADRQLDLGG